MRLVVIGLAFDLAIELIIVFIDLTSKVWLVYHVIYFTSPMNYIYVYYLSGSLYSYELLDHLVTNLAWSTILRLRNIIKGSAFDRGLIENLILTF